jgi:hypothetical protein
VTVCELDKLRRPRCTPFVISSTQHGANDGEAEEDVSVSSGRGRG